MKLYHKQFLGKEDTFYQFETAAVAVLPFPYEGGVSYGKGTSRAPDAILDASEILEFYDEVIKAEVHRMGITTVAPPHIPAEPELMQKCIHEEMKKDHPL